ncbi:MAG: hypothetical protein HYT89_00955 [Candidatus Omnitrophica bacterium]|nr:hypothetical protein [Candidatus Omnitrophota bacterium]
MGKKHRQHFLKYRSLYEEAIRRHVCAKCVDLGEDGFCRTKDPQGCGIFRNLLGLVEVALNLHELRLGPYIRAVRSHVCSQCVNSMPGEKCPIRESLDCGLDRYLGLVFEAIEAVDRSLQKEKSKSSPS